MKFGLNNKPGPAPEDTAFRPGPANTLEIVALDKHVVATVPDPHLLTDDEEARRIALRMADFLMRVGSGVGLIHQSTVYIDPETA